MEHLIRFRTAAGIDGTHVAPEQDDAVAFVERLRNVEGATDVRLYRLTEVPIEFKPYYRVEIVGGTSAAAPARLAVGQPSPPPGDPALPLHGDPGQAFSTELPESSAANGRRLFSRGGGIPG